MQISCPNCQAIFLADQNFVKCSTKFKCSKCKHVWDKKNLEPEVTKINGTYFFKNSLTFLTRLFFLSLISLLITYYATEFFLDKSFKISLDSFSQEDDNLTVFIKIEKSNLKQKFTLLDPKIIKVVFLQDNKIIDSKFLQNDFSNLNENHTIIKVEFKGITTNFNNIDLQYMNIIKYKMLTIIK